MGQDELVFAKSHGPLFGEVTETSVVVWYRDEDGVHHPPFLVYWKDHEEDAKKTLQLNRMDPECDYTSKTPLTDLEPATNYLCQIVSSGSIHNYGDDDEHPRLGSFKTSGSAAVNFMFGCCIGGQEYGRYPEDHPDGPGFPIFKAMAELEPDFFQCQGDFIYADNAIYKNSQSPFFAKQVFQTPNDVDVLEIAQDLPSFRARYKYNLEDHHLGEFLRNTVVFQTWDDHEIFDDWGKEGLSRKGRGDLFMVGEKAFHEYWPCQGPPEEPKRIYRKARFGPHVELFILDTRSYRAAHAPNPDDPGKTPSMLYILGSQQKQWLLDGLKASTCTWKFICTSVPISYPTGWPRPDVTGYDGWSDGNDEGLGGPELELQSIFFFIHTQEIQNVVFISGDVHFPFCISYDPFESGKPLIHEIGSTPLHALCLPTPERGPDQSFRPTTLFARGTFGDQSNLNFGHVLIDEEGVCTMHLRDIRGKSFYEITLEPSK